MWMMSSQGHWSPLGLMTQHMTSSQMRKWTVSMTATRYTTLLCSPQRHNSCETHTHTHTHTTHTHTHTPHAHAHTHTHTHTTHTPTTHTHTPHTPHTHTTHTHTPHKHTPVMLAQIVCTKHNLLFCAEVRSKIKFAPAELNSGSLLDLFSFIGANLTRTHGAC